MQANRAAPRAAALSQGVLISLVCFCALFVGIAHLMSRFLSFAASPRHGLMLDAAAILLIVAGGLRLRRRRRAMGR